MDKLTKTAGAKLTAEVYRRLESKAVAAGITTGEYVRALIIRDLATPETISDGYYAILCMICALEEWLFKAISTPAGGRKPTQDDLEKLRERAMGIASGLAQNRSQQFRQQVKGAKA